MSDPEDSEALARRLVGGPGYRVVRRVRAHDVFADPVGETKVGGLLDTETTGLDRRHDQIIELAIIAFEYGDRGHVCRALDRFQAFADPGHPIPATRSRPTSWN
ncbi:exonuclease domain-containing protein [Thalassobaculum sp.]|uniref:exonuclease domain-containing protein n=1 Tax=Thalassobaculum sp. TaxID=2022740 RepID=UPI0032EF6927